MRSNCVAIFRYLSSLLKIKTQFGFFLKCVGAKAHHSYTHRFVKQFCSRVCFTNDMLKSYVKRVKSGRSCGFVEVSLFHVICLLYINIQLLLVGGVGYHVSCSSSQHLLSILSKPFKNIIFHPKMAGKIHFLLSINTCFVSFFKCIFIDFPFLMLCVCK